ncbi:protein BREAKING OF ASYMMETRY IN THE STOMATAL LINEAGE [Medicago truncatula]|uniref:protein BREAKING OF ASYMMETRY IN THE STOMATAL LINEAGE n=1 Tax=Medicago truncatula TaxID=3880 RepID=UPI0019687F89|nr:protein BREAKING OF ASYMMETRY IN THE STOMATAL LINEAGE [Medicago truncatula]
MQLDYNESAEVRNQHIEKHISNANQHDTDQHDIVYLTPIKEDEAKETISLSSTQHRDNIGRSCQKEEIEDGRLVSNNSRNSNQSEGSRGSFAFPELAWEMKGSPVKMPKSEDPHIKKQKIRCVGFQCFRF